jgi:hypothetical protein
MKPWAHHLSNDEIRMPDAELMTKFSLSVGYRALGE